MVDHVHGSELLLLQQLDRGAHEAVQHEHVSSKVEDAEVREGREKHGEAGGLGPGVRGEPLEHISQNIISPSSSLLHHCRISSLNPPPSSRPTPIHAVPPVLDF